MTVWKKESSKGTNWEKEKSIDISWKTETKGVAVGEDRAYVGAPNIVARGKTKWKEEI